MRDQLFAGIFKNAVKNQYSGGSLCRRQSMFDYTKAPIIRNEFHSRGFTQFTRSIYNKKNLGFSMPTTVIFSRFASTASSASKNGVVGWYLGLIKSRPILTKSITSGLIYNVADLSSQAVSGQSSEPFDILRTLRMGGYGLIIVGPAMHFWFNFVSKVLPNRDVVTTLIKIVMGQTLFGPVMTAGFFSANAALQGENSEEILARLKRDLVPTMINGVMYWPFCDFLTFKFTPVHLQPLVSNSFAYLWTVYLTYMASLEKPDVV